MWFAVRIIEHLASQHFRVGTTSQRVKFMEFMARGLSSRPRFASNMAQRFQAEIGRFRLPSFATRCWNITREHLELMLQGVGLDEEQEDPNSSKPRLGLFGLQKGGRQCGHLCHMPFSPWPSMINPRKSTGNPYGTPSVGSI